MLLPDELDDNYKSMLHMLVPDLAGVKPNTPQWLLAAMVCEARVLPQQAYIGTHLQKPHRPRSELAMEGKAKKEKV